MVTTRQNPIMDTQKTKRRESKHNTEENQNAQETFIKMTVTTNVSIITVSENGPMLHSHACG